MSTTVEESFSMDEENLYLEKIIEDLRFEIQETFGKPLIVKDLIASEFGEVFDACGTIIGQSIVEESTYGGVVIFGKRLFTSTSYNRLFSVYYSDDCCNIHIYDRKLYDVVVPKMRKFCDFIGIDSLIIEKCYPIS